MCLQVFLTSFDELISNISEFRFGYFGFNSIADSLNIWNGWGIRYQLKIGFLWLYIIVLKLYSWIVTTLNFYYLYDIELKNNTL